MPVAASDSNPDSHYQPSVLIPVFDHEGAIGATLEAVLELGYPVLMVDDGSGEACRDKLIELQRQHPETVSLVRLDQNSGKGAAVKFGLRTLREMGVTHAIQIDADGQHDLSCVEQFVDSSRQHPVALVIGYPEFDESVPRLRYYARYLTHVWVWINTLSLEIIDTMCGLRVYPVAGSVDLLDQADCGDRMSFDTELVVRWKWGDGALIQHPTRVNYPLDGVSHFRGWLDNTLITGMHTRLFFGMLWRLPRLLWRKVT